MWDPKALTRRCRSLEEVLAARRPTPAKPQNFDPQNTQPPAADPQPIAISLEIGACSSD